MPSTTHLFTIRIWQEEVGDGRSTPRGQLKHGLYGETRSFQGWSALVEMMEELVRTADGDEKNSDAENG